MPTITQTETAPVPVVGAPGGDRFYLSTPKDQENTIMTQTTVRWNPYESLATEFRDVQWSFDHELPGHTCGLSSIRDGRRKLWVCSKLRGVRRECVLAHELVHLQRGLFFKDPDEYDAEERAVEEITARRMIPDADLYKLLLGNPSDDFRDWAKALRVDQTTMLVRLLTLTPVQRSAATTILGRPLPQIPELYSFDKPSGFRTGGAQ